MNDDPIGQKLRDALTFTRLAKQTKAPEMLSQHLVAIERNLEYVLRNTEAGRGQTQAE